MRDIEVFLRFANFYRRFIQKFSRIAALLTSMLKTSCTKSAEPKKGVIRVGGGGRNKAEPVGKYEFDGNDGGSCNDDFNKKCSLDAPKLMCPPAPLTSMLKTSSSINSSTSTTQSVVEYDGIDDDGSHSGDLDKTF